MVSLGSTAYSQSEAVDIYNGMHLWKGLVFIIIKFVLEIEPKS